MTTLPVAQWARTTYVVHHDIGSGQQLPPGGAALRRLEQHVARRNVRPLHRALQSRLSVHGQARDCGLNRDSWA